MKLKMIYSFNLKSMMIYLFDACLKLKWKSEIVWKPESNYFFISPNAP